MKVGADPTSGWSTLFVPGLLDQLACTSSLRVAF